MNDLLAQYKIIEVQEGGKNLANWYLKHGYILLDIQTGSRGMKFASSDIAGQQYYVRRNPVFIVGRTEEIKHAPYPPKYNKEELPPCS